MVRVHETGAVTVVVVVSPDAMEQPWIGELGRDGHVHVLAVVGAARPALDILRARRPDVVLIDRAPEHAAALLREAAVVAPATAGVALLAGHSMSGVRRLVSAGARDVLAKPLHRDQLRAALRAAALRERERPRRQAGEQRAAEAPGTRAAGLVVLLGAKGGVGNTTIAANLAVAMQQIAGDVALVDFSDQFGDLGVLFNALPRKTLHRQALAGAVLDDSLLDHALIRHASGVALALAPEDPLTTGRLDAGHVTLVLDALQRRFCWIVVDCRSRLDRVALAAVAAAGTVLLVTTPDVLALRNARRVVEYLSVRGLGRDRGAVLHNRCVRGAGPSSEEVERFVGLPVLAALLDAPAAYAAAAERGVPLAQVRPLLPEARRLLFLAAAIAGDPAGAELRTIG